MTKPKGFFKYARPKLKTNPRIGELEQVFSHKKTLVRLPAFENRPCSSELTHLNITSEEVKQLF